MGRFTLRLLVAAVTFAVGTAAAAVYFLHSAPAPEVAPAGLAVGRPADEAVRPTCFPGRAVPVAEAESHGLWRYFPRGSFDAQPERERFLVEWYEKHLGAMGEPALSVSREDYVESYRFLWLRSFHPPVAVRVWRTEDGQFISAKELSGAGGYEPGRLIAARTRPLKAEEWDEFTRLLERACYWNLEARRDIGGCDGAQWILEGARGGRYHVVDWWTPQTGEYREACLYLLKLGQVALPAEEVY